MGLSRSRTLLLIGLLVLIALSLHPAASVESILARVFAPTRFVAELARPLWWFGARDVRAAEAAGTSEFDHDVERSRAVLLAAQRGALPSDPALTRGRALLSAHVIARLAKKKDELVLRFPANAGVAVGMPVVYGDVYVGRISSLDAERPGEGTASLVTTANFRVGAEVDDGVHKGSFVVGGLMRKSRGEERGLQLLAQFPSDRSIHSGLVRVREDAASPEARLADGYRLGQLVSHGVRGMNVLTVEAAIDYEWGLNHVAIVCPPQMGTAGPVLAVDPFDATAWIDARALLAGDASIGRRTRKLSIGSRSGARAGAAIGIGARFVGRVIDVSAWSSNASLFGDPGVAVSALAVVDGVAAPIALGHLVSLGVDSHDGSVLVSWKPIGAMRAEGVAPRNAELWTAAGERDVPPGLLIGTTSLPSGEGPFTLRVRAAVDAQRLLHLRVWRGPEIAGDDDAENSAENAAERAVDDALPGADDTPPSASGDTDGSDTGSIDADLAHDAVLKNSATNKAATKERDP